MTDQAEREALYELAAMVMAVLPDLHDSNADIDLVPLIDATVREHWQQAEADGVDMGAMLSRMRALAESRRPDSATGPAQMRGVTAEQRPMRPCAGCDVVDDHPRHVIGAVNVAPGTDPPDPWHLDCHAAVGCASCAVQLAAAGDRRGDQLAAFFASLRETANG